MCRDGNVAEDLAQETFYQAYLAIPGFRGQCEMFTWLAAIAKNQYFRYLRKTRKESFLIDVYETEPNAPESDEPAYRILRERDHSFNKKRI